MEKLIAGVDEVGRGSLVGPVVAAAVVLGEVSIFGLKDSKKLSEKKRYEIAQEIQKKAKSISIGIVSSKIIDKINIKRASILAMQKAVLDLNCSPSKIVVDGLDTFESKYPLIAIVKADNLVPEVMAASIIAKVYRDELLRKLDRKHPEFSFSSHKGYPTKKHIEAINTYGIIKEHRKSFSPIKNINE